MDEETLISLAIDRAQRAKFRNLPKDSKKRVRMMNKLNHAPPLDLRCTKWFSSFAEALSTVNIKPTVEVYMLSCTKELDGRYMPFHEAIDATRKAGWGTIIGISPCLAIYYGEEGKRGAVIRKEN